MKNMDMIEVILISAIIIVIVIDFFFKKKKREINLNLIGDENEKYESQSKFYFFKIYLKKFLYKLILGFFGISLILTNPKKNDFKHHEFEHIEKFVKPPVNHYTYLPSYIELDGEKFHEVSNVMKFNFFIFSIYERNYIKYNHERQMDFIVTTYRKKGIKKTLHKQYIGIFNTFHFIQESENYYNP